jgi:hypothetical protein
MKAGISGQTLPATAKELRRLLVVSTRQLAVSFPRPDEFSGLILVIRVSLQGASNLII